MTYDVFGGTLNLAQSINPQLELDNSPSTRQEKDYASNSHLRLSNISLVLADKSV